MFNVKIIAGKYSEIVDGTALAIIGLAHDWAKWTGEIVDVMDRFTGEIHYTEGPNIVTYYSTEIAKAIENAWK